MDINIDKHVCYVDFEKAFDKVRHEKLVQILQAKNIDKGDQRIITNLYWNQRAQIIVDNKKFRNKHKKRSETGMCYVFSAI